ncbi:MAG: twin-arginine translocation signal domain-containing protein, partial [Hyphococcus sp.]
MDLSRRKLLKTSAAGAAIAALPAACSRNEAGGSAPAPDPAPDVAEKAGALLEKITDQLLTFYPENATNVGVDTGAYASLRAQMTDRSPEGQETIASVVRDTLAELNDIDTAALDPDQALNIDVVRTVYESAAEGFDFPHGDMAVLNWQWSYRNSPYAVAQNTGAFFEIPSFLDSSH